MSQTSPADQSDQSPASPARPGLPRTVLGVGAVLVLLGVVAYAATGAESATALIPAFLGVLLLVAGALRPRLGRAADLSVLVLAAVGLLGSLRVLTLLPDVLSGESDLSGWAVGSQLAMIVLCGWLVVVAVLALRQRRG